MGRKPMAMCPVGEFGRERVVPAEWMLDVFDKKPRVRPAPYQFEIQTPPMPWMLRYGNICMAITLLVGGIAIYFTR